MKQLKYKRNDYIALSLSVILLAATIALNYFGL